LTTLPTTTTTKHHTYYCLAFGSTSSTFSSRKNNSRTSNYPTCTTINKIGAHTCNSAHREIIMGGDDDENNNEKKNNDRYYKGSINSLEKILKFTRTNPNAIVLTLWPSAIGYENNKNNDQTQTQQIDVAKLYLQRSGAALLYESALEIPETVSTLLVMAMYWGEDWLKSNCWYQEQPLEELGIPGLTRQSCSDSSWPGAQWKKELCFRQQQQQQKSTTTTTLGEEREEKKTKTKTKTMYILIADVGNAPRSGSNNNNTNTINKKRGRLWSDKYLVRAMMARDTGHAGNSCMHLTDDQSGIVARSSIVTDTTSRNNNNNKGDGSGSGGMECNASYAFACARLLLNHQALEFLVHCATTTTDGVRVVNNNGDDTVPSSSSSSKEFERVFTNFCQWLGDRNFEDIVTVPDVSSLDEKHDMNENRKEESSSSNTNGITMAALGKNKKWNRAPLG